MINKNEVLPILFISVFLCSISCDFKDYDGKTAEEWRAMLQDDNPVNRKIACEKLCEIRYKKAVPSIIKVVAKDASKDVRIKAMFSLGVIRDKSAVQPLLKILEQDKDIKMRSAAAASLALIGDKESVGKIERILLKRDKEEDVVGLILAIGQIGKRSVETETTLLPYIDDKNEKVRRVVFFALGYVGGEKTVQVLLDVLMSKNEIDRWDALGALGRIGDKSSVEKIVERGYTVPALLDVLQNEPVTRRGQAAYSALLLIGYLDSKAIIDRMTNSGNLLQKQLIFLVAKIKCKPAIPALIKISSDNHNENSRHAKDVLVSLVGEDFGDDTMKWRTWWEKNKDKIIDNRNFPKR